LRSRALASPPWKSTFPIVAAVDVQVIAGGCKAVIAEPRGGSSGGLSGQVDPLHQLGVEGVKLINNVCQVHGR
jgi:hypothetical protein